MPKTKVSNSNDPRFGKLRNELGRLCTEGVERSWVLEVANHLLELDTVKARLNGADDDDSKFEAVVAEVREAVGKLGGYQHKRLLGVVLGLDDKFLGMSARGRREFAGIEFRGGQRPVGRETIRKHHEPKALDKLTELLLKRNPLSTSGGENRPELNPNQFLPPKQEASEDEQSQIQDGSGNARESDTDESG